jgi:predicted GNAT superfamily acetyltransferase
VLKIRDLATHADFADCIALQEATWGEGFSERVPAAILRVGQKIGGVSAGAFDASGKMVGFVFGMTGVRDGELVHWSDMLAVRRELRSQGIGEQLKQYQREKVVAIGVTSMLWTYDPLQAGNAHFNINHLGAMPIEYVPDMYGTTGGTLHGTLPTDRFIVRWELSGTTPVRAIAGDAQVEIPADINTEQRVNPSRALEWRLKVREAITARIAEGYSVAGFHRATSGNPYYILQRGSAATP